MTKKEMEESKAEALESIEHSLDDYREYHSQAALENILANAGFILWCDRYGDSVVKSG